MTDIADALGRAVLDDAGVDERAVLGVPELLAVVAASARAERESEALLRRAVVSARAAGASWALIGAELGMSRQAAQQRFGGPAEGDIGESERWLGPVTARDEMTELELAGRAGWHTVEAGMLAHRVVRTATQWEHRRVRWRGVSPAEAAEGWQVGCRAFPWTYLIRDTGVPAEAG